MNGSQTAEIFSPAKSSLLTSSVGFSSLSLKKVYPMSEASALYSN